MAAAYASLVSLTTVIDQVQNHPCPPITLDEEQVESLRNNINFLQEFLELYSNGVIQAADGLESLILKAANAAEDVIESHVADQILGESTSRAPKKTETVDNLYQILQKAVDGFDFLKKEAMDIKERRTITQDCQVAAQKMVAGYPSNGKKNYMVGFDDVLLQVLDKLIAQQTSRQIMLIVGMGGIGKTTLARNVYKNQLVVYHFHFCSWVTISQEYNVREVLLGVLSNEKDRESGEELSQMSEQELGEALYKRLSGRRYLVILDDMWGNEVWDKIKYFFPENENGSRILITTRMSNMASLVTESYSIKLNFLDKDQSWELLCKNVFQEEACPIELEKVGKKIAKNCKGLPLSITVISGLLAKSTRTQDYWENIAKNLKSILNLEDDKHCIRILYMSYSYLPIHLKPCFLYMGVFPEDKEISASFLIKLWLAEGFLKPISGKSVEVVAEEYLKDLVDRNLILVKSFRFDGRIKQCYIHDLLWGVCLKEAEKEKFLSFFGPRNLGVQNGMNAKRCIIHHGISTTPEVMFKFVNSRFICVYENYLSCFKLPLSVLVLWNLQTLIINDASVINVPREIWKMNQLRHIKAGAFHLPDPPSGQDIGLWNLQSMSSISNLRFSGKVVRRIPSIRRLKCSYTIFKYYYSDYFINLSHLQKLESLTLNVYKGPKLVNLQQNINLPSSLKKLSLNGSKLHWEDVTTKLGSLPHLQVLKLHEGAVEGFEWSLVEGKFCSLKILEIHDCNELKYWVAESIHFPRLSHISLKRLYTLKAIPSGIGEIPTLQSIELKYCGKNVVNSAEKILKEQEELGNFGLKITTIGLFL